MKEELILRWTDPAYVATRKRDLASLIETGKASKGIDARGLVVGETGPLSLISVHFANKCLEGCDFTHSTLHCSFADAILTDCTFSACSFDDAFFSGSQINSCNFAKSRIVSCSFDDAKLAACDFSACQIADRRQLGCSWLRARLLGCNFDGAVLKGAEFRGTHFVDCVFAKTEFRQCDLRGVKFIGATDINPEQFVNCNISGVTVNGEPLA